MDMVFIGLNHSLTSVRDKDWFQGGDEIMSNVITAKRLVDEGIVVTEAGRCYHDAMQGFLTRQVILDNRVKGLNSEHVYIQLDVEAPLRDSYQASWGLIQSWRWRCRRWRRGRF
jgi:hypothetical protein